MRWFIYRVDKAQGASFVEHKPKVDAYVQYPPFSVTKKLQSQPRVLKPAVPPDWFVRYLAGLANDLEVLLQPEALQKYIASLKKYRRHAQRVEQSLNAANAAERPLSL